MLKKNRKSADINIETREIYIQGGIDAYGYGEYFKVPSVIIVTAMVDAKAKQKEQQERRQKRASSSFDKVFQEAYEDARRKDEIAYHTTGYTKDAKGFINEVRMRDYR